jgi:hypothetical protein
MHGQDFGLMKSDIRSFGQNDVRWFFARSWPRELLAILCEAGYKTAVGKEELSAFDSHKTIEPIRFACRVVAEAGRGQFFSPTAVGEGQPKAGCFFRAGML